MTEEIITDPDLIAFADGIESEHPPAPVLHLFDRQEGRAGIVPEPIDRNCSRRYRAHRNSGRRPLSAIKWVVLHSTEGDTAAGAAAWFQNPDSRGSAHLCLDDNECYRTLDNDQIPWGAPGTNYGGIHIEQAGYARWTRLLWSRTHRRTLQRAAYKTALHLRLFGLPPRFVAASGLRRGLDGVTTHKQATLAFGGSHTDPGRGWPRYLFMFLVRRYYGQLEYVEPVA